MHHRLELSKVLVERVELLVDTLIECVELPINTIEPLIDAGELVIEFVKTRSKLVIVLLASLLGISRSIND